jgi:hypothetical protein
MYENKILDCVVNYKYLGLYFSASGSFFFAQNELHKNALKAYYKLHKDLLTLNPNNNTSLHVFDHTIKPILLYGCEIWGSFNPTTTRFRNETIALDKIYQNFKCELLHTKFCRFILGVHKKSTNFGLLSELGRFPIYYDIFKSMLNYCHQLETLDSTFPILQDAYITSKTLFESKTISWYGSIHTILEQIPVIKNLDQLCIKLSSFKNKAKIHLKSKFIELWRDQMLQQTNGKLRSYITFKSNIGR